MVGRRRTLLVNPRFQLRAMLIPSIVAIFSVSLLVFLHFLILSPGPERADVGDGAITLKSLLNSGWLLTSIGFSVIYASLFLFLSLLETHKAAGAVFKIKTYLSRVAEGDLRSRVKLRKKDHFQDVADEFNAMADTLLADARSNDELSERLGVAWDQMVELKHRKQQYMS
jgi:methyl-accepting chemotaxis protein